MPISLSDFAPDPGRPVAERSARFDPERPFLFEGLSPRFATKLVKSCFVPMRDGVRLSTDFHIPLGANLPLPVVLVRTPYGKRGAIVAMPALLPEQGIVYAVQDVRGRYESEGEFIACSGVDRDDGYDTLSWLANQPWCNGAIGTMGSSYSGETAAKIAATCHPNHRCGVIMFDGSYGGGTTRNGAYLQGGVTLLRMMFDWFRNWVPKYSFGPPPHVDREAWFSAPYGEVYTTQPVAQPAVDLDQHLRTLPVWTLLDRSGAAPSEFADMMRRSADPGDPYWNAQGYLTEKDRFHTPTLHLTGPLERGGSSFENLRLFRANAITPEAREHQYLIFTPAPHSQYHLCSADSRTGPRYFGDTRFPYYRLLIDWFSHWLRADPLDLEQWPRVRYFAINRGWRTCSEWPSTDARSTRLFLDSKGQANGLAGDGVLSWTVPTAQACDRFTYDPEDPVPSEPPGTGLDMLGSGYADRSSIEERDDVLVYTSDPLQQAIEIAGPVSVELYVSSSAKDTDFAAVLSEVDPQGTSINVTHGLARMRYREGLQGSISTVAGQIYRVVIELWHAAIEFPVGHRIRLSITSSHFPFYDRNLNTGKNNYTDTSSAVAENTVHHDSAHPSALILSVRPCSATPGAA